MIGILIDISISGVKRIIRSFLIITGFWDDKGVWNDKNTWVD